MSSDEIDLDIFAQQERINTIYTQLVLCFPYVIRDEDDIEGLLKSLDAALQRLHQAFPWTSGNVVRNDEQFAIRKGTGPRIVFRDLRPRSDYPDFDALANQNFPYRWLDEKVVSNRRTIADPPGLHEGLPVLVVQMNIIKGGILLSFDCQHGSMDMATQAQVIRLFAKACRGETYATDELNVGNMSRKGVVPLLDYLEPDPPPTIETTGKGIHDNDTASPLKWAYLGFCKASLEALKESATRNIPSGTFISTDDVLSAFIWQAITRARLPRLKGASGLQSTLSRNVDGRRCLSLPSTYPGLIVTSTTHTKPLHKISETPLSALASDLRSALTPQKLKYQLQKQATLLGRGVTPARPLTSSLDVRLSSWAKEDACGVDFGFELGRAIAVRTPRFEEGAREGLVYFLPKTREGELVVGICLQEYDMRVLKGDEEVGRYAVYIG